MLCCAMTGTRCADFMNVYKEILLDRTAIGSILETLGLKDVCRISALLGGYRFLQLSWVIIWD